MDIVVALAIGLVIGGFAGLFASLGTVITWLIALSIFASIVLPGRAFQMVDSANAAYMLIAAFVGFFGTLYAVIQKLNPQEDSEKLSIRDFIVWNGFRSAEQSSDKPEQPS